MKKFLNIGIREVENGYVVTVMASNPAANKEVVITELSQLYNTVFEVVGPEAYTELFPAE